MIVVRRFNAWAALAERGSDGFEVMFPYLPGGLDDFVGKVAPEPQRRGIFRNAYVGTTLCEHFGLPRPESQFFPYTQFSLSKCAEIQLTLRSVRLICKLPARTSFEAC